MRLLHYVYDFKYIKKTALKMKQFFYKEKIQRLNFLSNIYMFNTSNWILINSTQSLSLCSRLISFLKKKFFVSMKIRNQNSRLHLLKMRIEHSCFNVFIYDNWILTDYLPKRNICTAFNNLQMIPRFKNILSRFTNLQIKVFLKNFNGIFFIIKLNFSKKKNLIFLSTNKNFHFLQRKVDNKKNLFFESVIMEKLNLLSESICILLGLMYLITCRRNFYSCNVLIFFIKTCFIKMNYFREILIADKNRKLPRIDPAINNFLRSEKNKLLSFLKIAAVDFKILPSKNRIPLHFYIEIYENFRIFKRQIIKIGILKNMIEKKLILQNFRILKKEKSFAYKKHKFFDKNDNYNSKKETCPYQKKSWLERKNNIKKGTDNSLTMVWTIENLLVKESGDFHNEILGVVFIAQIEKIFRENFLDMWLSSFFIYSIHSTGGLINIVPNSISLHDLNKGKINNKKDNIKNGYESKKKRQYKFIESLAAYSLFCFVFQLKDRHNGNILVNSDSRIVHVDFGYILGYVPGNLKFEADSFKLSENFLLEISGKQTEKYEYFRELFIRGFILLKKNFAKIIMIMRSFCDQNKCINDIVYKMKNFEKRFKMHTNDKITIRYALHQIQESIGNWKTLQYDKYQLYASGIN
nr:SNF1-related kinase [Cryptomonas sp.]